MILALPLSAYAQASIAGVVKDASGAVLPGVTVEATSPVLIEKARTAVTDEAGQYRIVDLRAGAYTVSFALVGFSTVRREGIELSGSFIAVVNADLKVGAIAETITVSGETPIVDTQSVRRQTTISGDLITAIPSARSYAGLMTLMPNTVVATGAASDVQVVPGMVVFGGAGGRSNEGRLQLDGISVGSAFNGGGVSAYIADVGNAQEVALTSSGGLGEAEVGGPSMNVVPKTGGNSVKGSVYLSGVTKGMVGSNYTDDLKARGLSTPGSTTKVWDFNGAVGGPIKKDRLWFFYTLRDEGTHKTVPGMFANLNAGDPTKWTYAPDRNRPAVQAASFRTTSLRLTAQATPRNQFRVFWDEQMPCEGAAWPGSTAEACRHSGDNEIIAGGTAAPTPAASATAAPETASYRDYGTRFRQVSYQSPITSRLLAEASVGNYASRYLGNTMPGSPAFDFIQVTEQCAAGCPANDNRAGLVYRGGTFAQGSAWQGSNNWRASLSYVEGKHSMKFGYQGGYLMQDSFPYTNSQFMTFRVNNGVPNQINEIIDYNAVQQRVKYDAFYAQDQWTMGRITLQGALRFDRATSIFPAVEIGGVRFLPTVISFPETKGVDAYKDLTPRGGVAIDLSGDGKTALKFNFGRYLEAAQNGGLFIASRPTSRISTTASRAWTDANANFRPDCDLSNNAAQDLRAGGGDFCGAVANTNFGKSVFDTTQDPALFNGWGVRSGDWQWGASIQRQVAPRVSVELSYLRRWLLNFVVTDNLAIAPSNFDPFTVTAPVDARLPNGGGYAVPGPLYNVNPSKASVPANNFVTLDTNYGGQSQTSNAIALNLSARPRNGLVIQGGFNTNDTSFDYCSIRAAMPELTIVIGPPTLSPTNPYCSYNTGWVTRFTALGSYTIPKVDVLIGGTLRSDQGGVLAANWAAPNSAISPSLGRNLSNNAPSATVNLITPGTLYGDRVNEVDLRLAKIIRIGRVRTNVGIDVYNMFNSAPVLTYNQAFVPVTATSAGSWLQPTSVLQARFFKVSAQIDF
jgi:hypothetical protein